MYISFTYCIMFFFLFFFSSTFAFFQNDSNWIYFFDSLKINPIMTNYLTQIFYPINSIIYAQFWNYICNIIFAPFIITADDKHNHHYLLPSLFTLFFAISNNELLYHCSSYFLLSLFLHSTGCQYSNNYSLSLIFAYLLLLLAVISSTIVSYHFL